MKVFVYGKSADDKGHQLEALMADGEYGLNDWRTALIRGLRACPGMNMSVVLNYRRSTSRTRDGRI